MSGFLLLPDDEQRLIQHLHQIEGLVWLESDDLSHGPRLVDADVIVPPLPTPAQPLQPDEHPRVLIFWCRSMGDLLTLHDAPEPTEAAHRVARYLTQEASADWGHVLDYERSPILRWHRSGWNASDALSPGLLQVQAAKLSQQPADLLRLHRRVSTWMQRQAVKIDPFDYAPDDLPVQPPQNRRAFVTWAFPAAEGWLAQGGRVWPWND